MNVIHIYKLLSFKLPHQVRRLIVKGFFDRHLQCVLVATLFVLTYVFFFVASVVLSLFILLFFSFYFYFALHRLLFSSSLILFPRDF